MKIIDSALERFSLPVESGGAPRLCLSGKTQLILENHKGLLELKEDCIVIASRTGNVSVTGEELSLGTMDKSSLIINGKILRIDLE